jgi:CHAT domain-containing protein/Tfp pilus assembly protein PilF
VKKARWVAFAFVCACACAGHAERTLERTFEDARTALRQGKPAEARLLADRGITLTDRQPDSLWHWRFRFLRGEILIARRELAEVRPLLDATIVPGPQFDPLRVHQAYLRARAQLAEGRLPDALATLDKSRQLGQAAPDLQLELEALDGQIRVQLGRFAEAETRLNTVVARAAAAGYRYQEAVALNILGMSQLVRTRYDQALPWFERLLALSDLEDTTLYGKALNNAGICYSRLGEFDRALATQRRALDVHRRRGPSADYEQALGELGNTYVLQGDSRAGLPYLQQALSVATQANLTADAALWAGNVANAHVSLHDWNEAERFNDEARRLKAASRSGKLVFNTLNAAHIAAGRGLVDQARTLFNEALADAEGDPSVRWNANDGLASLAVAEKRFDRAAHHFEAALETIERTRSDLLQTDYKLSFLTRLISFYQGYVDVLIDRGDVDRALEIADSSRGRVLAERQRVTPPARASAATFRRMADRSGRVLLSYWLAPARSYLWVVAADRIHRIDLPPASEVESLVREYRTAIETSLADPIASSHTAGDRLYRLLVEPAARWLPRGTSVVIVADGALHSLNFETLPVDGPRRRYLIEDLEIQLAPSLSMLTARIDPVPRQRSLLLIGDPTARNPEFPPLSYASEEMTGIARHFPDNRVTTHRHEHASPKAYHDARPDQFAMIHFTAHATASVASPLDSAVILAGPDNGFKLYARDVAERQLQADLVTVSACRSAGERSYRGEGLVGFAWAFLRAGARRVIAGLWDVDDRSTADVMVELYRRVAEGESPASALRAAKLTLIGRGGNFAKPYYWGPFELFTIAP